MNSKIANVNLNGVNFSVSYAPAESEVFSANRKDTLSATFISLPIDGTSNLMNWSSLQWLSTLPTGSKLLVFVKNASDLSSLSSQQWSGPMLNGTGEDLSKYTKRYLQIQLILFGVGWPNLEGVTPVVSAILVQGVLSSNEEVVYTKAFDLGFVPKNLVVTYNGIIPEGTILNIAVAGDDTTDVSRYISVNPNQIQDLSNLPDLSGKMKLMLGALGNNLHPFEINSIGVIVSGSGQALLNQ